MGFNMDQVSCKSRENIYVNTQSLDDLLFDVFSSVLFLLGRLSEIQAIWSALSSRAGGLQKYGEAARIYMKILPEGVVNIFSCPFPDVLTCVV
jgi:hypothetical protein